jgi:hypothetical protein
MPEPEHDDTTELADEQFNLAGITAGDSAPAPLAGDDGNKTRLLIMTFVVLFYPIVFASAYPFLASVLKLQENVEFPIGSWVIRGLESVSFVISGVIILIINLIVALTIQFHLQHVREGARATIGVIRGFAAAGGERAHKAIEDALARFSQLLSWRYLFSYIGPVTLALYVLFAFIWGFAAFGGFKTFHYFAPAARLAGWVLLYYAFAFGVRWLLRLMTREYLRSSID